MQHSTRTLIAITPGIKRAVLATGVFLTAIGIIGVFLPQVLSIAIALIIAWLLVVAGLLSAYFTWNSYRSTALAWLKPFILLGTGLLLLFNPVAGASAFGLLLAIYFLLDAFAGIALGLEFKPFYGWKFLIVNGVLSFLMGVVILFGWPFSAVWVVGFLIGLSLLFDGVTLIILSLSAEEI